MDNFTLPYLYGNTEVRNTKLIVAYTVNKLPTFYETSIFIIVATYIGHSKNNAQLKKTVFILQFCYL
jgi:hypothetical protein